MASNVVLLFCFSSVVSLVACVTKENETSSAGDHRCHTPPCFYFGSQLLIGINTSVDPCDDFHEYVCSKWVKEFSETESVIGTKETEINHRIKALLEGPVNKEDEALLNAKKYYNHCLNANQDELKRSMLQEFDQYGGLPVLKGASWDNGNQLKKLEDLFPLLANLRRKNLEGGLFDIYVKTNITDNSKICIQLKQPSSTLSKEDMTKVEQNELIHQLQWMNPELKDKIDMEEISRVLELRNSIKENLQNFTESEVDTNSNVITIEELTNVTKMDWLKLLNLIFEGIHTLKPEDKICVHGINYFEKLGKLADNNIYSPRNVMNYELIYYCFTALHKVISAANSADKCTELVENTCYEYAVSPKYGSVYLHTKALAESARTMAVKLFDVYHDHLEQIDWLDKVSRDAAQEKLKVMKDYFVYPAWTMNKTLLNEYYKDLQMKENVIQDFVACRQFKTMYNIRTLKQRPKLESWDFPPLSIDAYAKKNHNPLYTIEEMLHYPFFRDDLLQVMNYATMGFIIAHEIAHALDTEGIYIDKYGNSKPLLTPNIESIHQQKAQCLINQYSQYELTAEELPGTNGFKVDPKHTLNDNIADNGGIRQAYKGYKKWAQEFGEETLPDSLRKYSNDQVFFLSYARLMCKHYGNNVDWIKELSEDDHAPKKFRVIGVLTNLKEFSEAFHCSADSKMDGGDKRCILW